MKYYGSIGYAVDEVTSPGVHKEKIVEREYYGDVYRLSRNAQQAQNQINDNINLSNEISIISDPFAIEHLMDMRYVTWFGSKWKITNATVRFPRITLTIGGLYND